MSGRLTLLRLSVVAIVAGVTLALLTQITPGKLTEVYLLWIVPLLIPATLILIDAASTDGRRRRASRWGAVVGLAIALACLIVWASLLDGWEILIIPVVSVAVLIGGLVTGFVVGRVGASRFKTDKPFEPVPRGVGVVVGAVLAMIVVTFVYGSYSAARIALARYQLTDPTLTPEIVRNLFTDPATGTSWKVRYDIAAHPKTPTDVLKQLFLVPNIKAVVLQNPGVPCYLIESVLQYPATGSNSTRERLVAHYGRTCPQSALAVRRAADPTTPPEELASAVQSGNLVEQWAAWKNPSTPVNALVDHVELAISQNRLAHLWRIAKQPDARPEVLDALARDDHPDTLRKVAANPNTSEPLLRNLATRPVRGILKWVGSNPSAPVDLLVSIVRNNPGSTDLQGVARNPKTPPALLQEMTDWLPRPDDPAARHKLQNYHQSVLPLIARNPTRKLAE